MYHIQCIHLNEISEIRVAKRLQTQKNDKYIVVCIISNSYRFSQKINDKAHHHHIHHYEHQYCICQWWNRRVRTQYNTLYFRFIKQIGSLLIIYSYDRLINITDWIWLTGFSTLISSILYFLKKLIKIKHLFKITQRNWALWKESWWKNW